MQEFQHFSKACDLMGLRSMSCQSSSSETITTSAKAECHNGQVNMIGLLDATHKAVHVPFASTHQHLRCYPHPCCSSKLHFHVHQKKEPSDKLQIFTYFLAATITAIHWNLEAVASDLSLHFWSSWVLVWCHRLGEITNAYDGIAMTGAEDSGHFWSLDSSGLT